MIYREELEEGKLLIPAAKKFFIKNKNKGTKLDPLFHSVHEKTFKKIDCLKCANCCKTTSPIFRDVDIKRITKGLKMKERDFIHQYLKLDEEDDYVLTSSPCPFLDLGNNECTIYELRPAACREYPHTNRKNAVQIGDLHTKNLDVCPAVGDILAQIVNI